MRLQLKRLAPHECKAILTGLIMLLGLIPIQAQVGVQADPQDQKPGYTIPIRDAAGVAGTSFSVEYEFSNDDTTTRSTAQVQPDGNLVISNRDIPSTNWNESRTTFAFSVTEPTSGTRVQYVFTQVSPHSQYDPINQPFLADWNLSPEEVGIFAGVILNDKGIPLADCPFRVIKDDGMVVHSGVEMVATSQTYFTGPSGEFRLAFAIDDKSAFIARRGYSLKTGAIPHQDFQLLPGQYNEIAPPTPQPLEVVLLDENGTPLTATTSASTTASLPNARATELSWNIRNYRLYPQPTQDGRVSSFRISDLPVPAAMEISAFGRIFDQKAVRKDESKFTLRARPLEFSVKGKIVDIHNQPMAGAAVKLIPFRFSSQASPGTIESQTDTNGNYELNGSYASMRSELTAEAAGFGTTVASPFASFYDPVQLDGRLKGHVAGPTIVLAKVATATIDLKELRQWSSNFTDLNPSRSLEPDGYFRFYGSDEVLSNIKATVSSPDIRAKFGNEGSSIARWNDTFIRKDSQLSISVPAEVSFEIYLSKSSSEPGYTAENLGPFSPGEIVDITDKLTSAYRF